MRRISLAAGALLVSIGLGGCASTRAAEAREQEARQGKRHDESQRSFNEARKQNAAEQKGNERAR